MHCTIRQSFPASLKNAHIRIYSLFDSAEQLPLHIVSAIVRLGKKYDVTHLLAAAVARLTVHFPHTLDEELNFYHLGSTPTRINRLSEDEAILFDAINLANENGLLAILPVAYFQALQVSMVLVTHKLCFSAI